MDVTFGTEWRGMAGISMVVIDALFKRMRRVGHKLLIYCGFSGAVIGSLC